MSGAKIAAKIAAKIGLKYERLQKILTLDRRVFKPCEAKEVEQWSWQRVKNEKWLVHLQKRIRKWKIKKLT